MSKIRDISGIRFGRLVAQTCYRVGRKTLWVCQCDCGNNKTVVLGQLTGGKTKSCGCLRRDLVSHRQKRHGMTATPEYRAFQNAKNRCERKADVRWSEYGGRGIKMAFADFDEFFAEVGPRPSSAHSLDRINPDGNYEAGNVRWATKTQQARNKRTARMVTVSGETRPLCEWAEIHGVPYKKAFERIFYGGWTPERALEIAQ